MLLTPMSIRTVSFEGVVIFVEEIVMNGSRHSFQTIYFQITYLYQIDTVTKNWLYEP